MQLAVDEGYSPDGAIQLLSDLERDDASNVAARGGPADEVVRVTVETMRDYFRTHPPSAERIAQIESAGRSQGWAHPPLKPLPYGVGASR